MLEARLHDADRERGDRDPSIVEDREELCEPSPPLTEEVGLGHAASAERQPVRVGRVPAHLPVRRHHGEAGRARGHDDRRDLTRAGPGRHRDDRCDRRARVGDELLLAVDDPLVGRVVERRRRACAAGVAAGVGLGEAEPADAAPRAEIGQPLLSLVLGAELEDRVRPEADAGLDRDRHRLVHAAELFEGDAERREVGTTAAVLGRKDQAEEAEVTHREHGVDRKLVRAIPGLDVRRDLGLGEVADDLPERLLLVAQLEVHGEARP